MVQGMVLIVEDEVEVAELLEFNLEAAGFATRVAHDGLAACRLVGREPPDLILLDLLLPDIDGWEVCRLIRTHPDPQIASTPIVMLTALTRAEDKWRGLTLGADDYLTKPFSMREVVLKAGNLVARRKEARALAGEVRRMREDRSTSGMLQSALFHELKNQLVVIGGYSRRLARSGAEPRKVGEIARVIERSSSYLSTISEQMLLLQRLEEEPGNLPREEVDVADVLATAHELHRPAADERGIRLASEIGSLRPAVLNERALLVIVSNLLENAVKYGAENGRVMLRAASAGPVVTVEVEDDGPGIPAEEREQVFEKFYRASSSAGRTRGTGLGLYVVKTLTRAMGGSVTLRSEVGVGTSVRVEFPPPAEGVRESSSNAAHGGQTAGREAHAAPVWSLGARNPSGESAL